MNKLFSKIAALSVGLAMAVGVGVAVGSKKAASVKAAAGDLYEAASSIAEGDEIILVGIKSGSYYAAGAQGNNNRPGTVVTNNDGVITITASTSTFTVGVSETNYFTFQDTSTSKYLYNASTSSKSYLKSQDSVDDKARWTVTIGNNGEATIVSKSTDRPNMKFNTNGSNDPLFNCYATGQTSVYIYKKAGAGETYTVSFNGNGGTGDMSSVPNIVGAYTLPDCTFGAPSNKAFVGWKAGNAGDLIVAGGSYSVSADVTFFAQWVDAYSVTYSAGEHGTGSYAHESQPTGTYSLLDFEDLTGVSASEGYRFKNYTVGGVDKDPGDTFELSANATVTVNFELTPLHVTLDSIGSTLGSEYNAEMATVDITDGSDSYTLNYLQGKKQGNAIIMQKSSGAFVSNHTVMPGDITSVEVYTNAGASGNATYDVAFGTAEFTTATAGIGAVNITGGSNHLYESNVASAKYFCITLGAAYNGQVLKIVVNYENSVDPSKKNMTIYTSGNPADGGTIQWSKNAGTHVFSAKEEETTVTGVTWSTSDSTVATINASTGAMTTVKPGNIVVYAEAEGYNKASANVTISKGWKVESVTVTGSMTKTSYTVGEAWSHSGLVATAEWNTGYEEDVSSTAEWTYDPASPALNVTSVVATATFEEVSGDSAAQVVTVTRTNPLLAIYSMSKDAAADVYGMFVGNKDGNNIIIMDGEYGMDVYKSGCGTNSYTAGTTLLHVVGTVDIYNGLYEIKATTIEVVQSADVDTPVVYAAKGGETAEYASRSTTVTGTPAVASGSKGDFSSAAGTNDITMMFTVGTSEVQVFYKKATQTADTDAYAAMADAVQNSTEITVKGFTAWFNGFQVQMTELVEAKEDYSAEDFAQDLLDQTDAICEGYDGVTNNKAALLLVWNDLAGSDKYPSLPSAEKTKLAVAERDESGDVVERAMARYDYLTGKYNLTNFINGRTPVVFVNQMSFETGNNSMAIIVVIASVSGLIVVGTLLILKKKKHN